MDAEIVEGARRGDPGAQEELVRRLTPRLLSLALRLGSDPQLAEELVEEALYRGMVQLKKLRNSGAAAAWFCRILLNLWRDALRRGGRQALFLEDLPEPAAAASCEPEAIAVAGELRDRVAQAVASLPPAQRAVLALHIDHGFTVAEIAAALSTTPERVKANLWHGRRRLRELLAGFLGERPAKEEH